MLKRLMLLLTTFIVLFAFFTYQPKKVDAFVSTAAKFVAQQTLKAVTKTSVDTTINKMLVDEVLDEVKKNYAVKNGFKLIENGGQKVLVKSSLDSAEKKLLKDEIDDVIEKQVYGNAPKWVVYADWFVGVGAVIMVGQLLYATVTGDFGSYISDLITEAMTNLGWLTPAPETFLKNFKPYVIPIAKASTPPAIGSAPVIAPVTSPAMSVSIVVRASMNEKPRFV